MKTKTDSLLAEKTAAGEKNNENARRDPLRPRYHAIAPSGWVNDPNGFSLFNGEYHLFYQYNPEDPRWNDICWGHLKSPDMVRWEHCPVAMAPDSPYDIDGVFSGTGLQYGDELYVWFTGHNVTGPRREIDQRQFQCLARGKPEKLEKHSANPLIEKAPLCIENHFRDPKVWIENGAFYMLLGSSDGDNSRLPVFKSPDGIKWEFHSVFFQGKDGEYGDMWECPDLFTLDGKDILMGNPMNLSGKGKLETGNVCYASGNVDRGPMVFSPSGGPCYLERGSFLYAPETILDKKGRRVLIGWVTPPKNAGRNYWSGSMSLPRELAFRDGRLCQYPLGELETLRGKQAYTKTGWDSGDKVVFGNCGIHGEFKAAFEWAGADDEVRIILRGMEISLIPSRAAVRGVELKNGKTEYVTPLPPGNGVDVDIFIDGMVTEFFIAGECLTLNIGAPAAEDAIVIKSITGKAALIRAAYWNMKDIGL